MLGLKLNHVSKRGHRYQLSQCTQECSNTTENRETFLKFAIPGGTAWCPYNDNPRWCHWRQRCHRDESRFPVVIYFSQSHHHFQLPTFPNHTHTHTGVHKLSICRGHHKRQPITRPWIMGCLLWVQRLNFFPSLVTVVHYAMAQFLNVHTSALTRCYTL